MYVFRVSQNYYINIIIIIILTGYLIKIIFMGTLNTLLTPRHMGTLNFFPSCTEKKWAIDTR